MSRGITARLALLFLGFAALLVIVVGVFAYFSGRAALRAGTIAELQGLSEEKAAAIDSWVQDRKADIALLAAAPDLRQLAADLLSAEPGSVQAINAHDGLLQRFQARASLAGFSELLLIRRPDGQVMVATAPLEEGAFRDDRPYFILGLQAPYVQNVYSSNSTQGAAITAAAPLRAPDDHLLGVLAGRMRLEELTAIVSRRTGLRQTDDAFLVNSSHLFITQPNFVSEPAVLLQDVHTDPVDHCLAGESGAMDAIGYSGRPVLAVYRWMPERDACLIVKMDQAEAYGPSRHLGVSILIGGVFALLLGALLAAGLARTITRPVLRLRDGARRIGSGDLEHRVAVRAGDEVAQLADSFNDMAASLAEKDRQVRAHAEQLEDANRELQAFTYSVSHDLRAPLRALDGFSRILQDEYGASFDAQANRYLDRIRSNAEQMSRLIDDLLAFSRYGRQEPRKQSLSPHTLVEAVLVDLQPELQGRQVELAVGEMPDCQADATLLKQVYLNLLSNALKYTRPRNPAVIEVGSRPSPDGAVYFVRDNGVGFDMRYAHKLFGVFQRLHSADEFEGTGVGLAIVQRIIHRHGGRVWAESQLGQGSTFYFTL